MLRITIAAVFGLILTSTPLTAQENPGDVMQSFIEDVQEIWVPLNRQENAPYDTRRAWTIDLVNTRFDIPHMSRRSLGTQWRTLSEEEQAAYSDLFSDLLVETVIDWLDGYDGEVFKILSVRDAGRNSEIVTRFEYADGQALRTTWVAREKNGMYFIRDARVSGISLTADFRGRHQKALTEGGVDGLFTFLAEQTARLRERQQ